MTAAVESQKRVVATLPPAPRRRGLGAVVTSGLAGALLAIACSPAPAPVSQSPRDPSNPSAAEGAAPVVAAIAAPVARASQAATYVCPMHPEVTSSAPGSCPKCNMKLVPQK